MIRKTADCRSLIVPIPSKKILAGELRMAS